MRFWAQVLLLSCLAVVLGCPGRGAVDDDAADDDAADDDTAGDCAPCQGDFGIENSTDFDDVERCESITGDLRVIGTDWLTSLDLPCLTSVGGDLEITANSALNSLNGLANLESVGGDLIVTGNFCLDWVEVDAFAAAIDVGGTVAVSMNGINYPCE